MGESGHPQRRQHHELEVGDIRVALHLSIESRWQQLNHSDESTPCPGLKLVHTRHLAIHASSLTNFACCDNYPLLYLTLQVIFWIGGLTPITGGSRRFHSQNGTVKLIGALEVLGAVGLTPLVTHIRRKKPPAVPRHSRRAGRCQRSARVHRPHPLSRQQLRRVPCRIH